MQPQALFSDDKIAALHDDLALGLEELGIAFALPEARDFAKAGAKISDEMVYIGRDIIKEALAKCPEITLKAPNPRFMIKLSSDKFVIHACRWLPERQ